MNNVRTPSPEPRLTESLSALPTPTPHTAVGPRALRVGVIHHDMLVAEQFFSADETNPVVLGNELGTDMHTPWATGIHRLPLFLHKEGKWHLRVSGGVVGVVLRGGKQHDVTAVRQQALAKGASPKNDILIPLDEGASGRLKFHDTRILFQFAYPPHVAPPPPLSKRFDRAFRRLDLVWWNFLLLMTVLQGVGMIVLQATHDAPADDAGFLSIPNVKMFVPEKPPEDKPPPDKNAKTDPNEKAKAEETAKAEEKQDKPRPKDAPDKPADPNARKAEIQQKLAKQTIIRYLAAVTDGDNNNIVSADQVGARLAAAWDGTPGVIGDEGETRSGPRYADKGGLVGKTAGLSDADLGDASTAAVDTGSANEVKVKGKVSASAADEIFGSGTLDKGAISGVVQRRLGAIKSCYERELKANPTLGGKVVIQFTIQESGRVADVKVTADTTGEPNVARCMVTQISHFKFPPPEGGTVTASYPFVLQPGT